MGEIGAELEPLEIDRALACRAIRAGGEIGAELEPLEIDRASRAILTQVCGQVGAIRIAASVAPR